MSPTLRSMVANSDESRNVSSRTPTESPSTTPRKTPHCTKCKRPRQGHPRSGCPFAESPETSATTKAQNVQADSVVKAMSSLNIAQDTSAASNAPAKARRKSSARQKKPVIRSDTLLSLSMNSNEIVAKLLEIGMGDRGAVNLDSSQADPPTLKVVKWQDTLQSGAPEAGLGKEHKPFSRSSMPGTLITPGSSFFESQSSTRTERQDFKHVKGEDVSPEPSLSPCPGFIQRSMSMEQRHLFISKLLDASGATIYVFPKADIEEIAEAAESHDFHYQILMNEVDDDDDEGLLVLGRSNVEVMKLLNKIIKEDQKPAEGKKSGALKAAAGGAVVGAVGAWAGLAFS